MGSLCSFYLGKREEKRKENFSLEGGEVFIGNDSSHVNRKDEFTHVRGN
jgi:hypothetical protein